MFHVGERKVFGLGDRREGYGLAFGLTAEFDHQAHSVFGFCGEEHD
jgi:hypothetical protein